MKRKQEEKPTSRIAQLEKELAVTTRNLEIEAALERVRARAMAMQNSDELAGLVTTLFNELSKLHFTLARCLIWIIDAETLSATTWMANPGVEAAAYQMQYFDHPYYKGIIKAWKERKTKWAYELKGEEKRALDDIVLNLPALKNTPEVVKAAMRAVDKAVISFSFANFGGLQVDGTEPLSEDNIGILGRFSKVFDQTYTRFSDLKKAEAQARQAQIEVAMEKVRSRSLAMQKPGELVEVAQVLRQEMALLGVEELETSSIYIHDDNTGKTECWYAIKDEHKLVADHMDINLKDTWVGRQMLKFYHSDKTQISIPMKGENRKEWINYCSTKSKLLDGYYGDHIPDRTYHLYKFSGGYMGAASPGDISAESWALLKRATTVFSFAYTRFSDLQQAHAQAREAQIEAALERVRSRTMGMQHSDELREVIQVIYEQFVHLGLDITSAGFTMDYKESDDWNLWMADAAYSFPNLLHIPYFDHPQWNGYNEAKRKGLDAFANTLTQEQKNSFAEQVNKYVPNTEEIKNLIYSAPGYAISNVFLKNVALFIDRYSTVPFSEADNAILQRFGKVFEQTYTRFKDLEQAEQQAREAKIEAGLERVRAKAMAMHNSEDLAETIGVFYHELGLLSVTPRRCGLGLVDKETHITEISTMNTTEQGESIEVIGKLKMTGHPVLEGIYDNWLLQKEYHPVLRGNEIKEYYQFVRPQISYPDYPNGVVQYGYFFFFRDGGAFAWTDTELPEDELQIYRRFNSVLSLTYRRYKDIKEAEAQARESQIQLGLERVRAKAMAMQTSEELNELIGTVFGELTKLDFVLTRCLIMIFDPETNSSRWWMANSEAPSGPMNYLVQYHKNPAYAAYLKAWKARDLKWRYALKGKVKRDWDNFLFVETELSLLPDFVIAGMKAPEQVLLSASFNNFGCLTLVSLEPLSDEHSDIMLRFAKVFDMSYTRFNDLKQAEAQAKEAQIQLALERVRARTMAMQKSDELAETATVLFQQLLNLGISAERTIIGIPNEDTRKIEFWGTEQGGNQINTRFEYDADATYAFREIYKGWQEKRSELTVILKGKNLDEHVNYVRNVLHMPLLAGLVKEQRMLYNAFFSKGWLEIVTPETQSKETLDILQRFAGVFDGTYIRFLDLQQAEAQAREAKIELGLERVRARAMAMQNSDELADLVATIFNELTKLDFSLTRCAIYIMGENLLSFRAWRANTEIDHAPESFHIKFTSHPFFNAFFKAWKERKLKWVYDLKGIEKQSLDDYFFNETEYSRLPDIVKAGMRQPERVFLSYAFNNFGGLQTSGLEPLSDANLDILSRFGKVFDMTYTRFNDLKQAEAQVREAKIEAALERVRSRTMAMFKSDELAETAVILFQQLDILGISPDRVFIGIFMEDTGQMECWATDQVGHQISNRFIAKLQQPSFAKIYTVWKSQEKSFSLVQTGKELEDYINYFRYELGLPFKPGHTHHKRVQNVAFFSKGLIGFTTADIPPPGIIKLLERFAGVFNLTYTRFLDLQKAETQAREAHIEASLERVRSKTMAMHNSQDVSETVALMFDELVKLGVEATSRLGIVIIDDTSHMEVWTASSDANGNTSMRIGRLDMTIHPLFQGLHAAWKNKETMFSYLLAGEDMKAYYHALNNSPDYPSQFNLDNLPKRQEYNSFIFPEGAIFIFSLQPLATEITQIFKKFAGVFGQTYRRYLDLQKAEAQAREAQIEASLERVRSKTMAMHNSHDVGDTIAAMFSEFVKLGIETIRCGILIGDSTNEMEVWTAKSNPDGVATLIIGRLDITIHPLLQGVYSGWKNKEPTFEYKMTGDDMKDYYRAINNSNYYPVQFDIDSLPLKQVHTDFFFADGAVFAFTAEPIADSAVQIFKRFAGVFGQTYRRYLDLQKAETQARESQIEASLERVRGKALAMYNSKDLSSTASLVFTELRKLGVNSKRCGVALLSKNSRHTQLYVATTTLDTDSLDLVGAIELSGHPSLEKQYESWLKNEDYFTVLKGEELKSYKELIYSMLPVPYDHTYHEEFGYYLAFSEGFLFSWAEKPFSEIEVNILNRFKSIIDLTFRRYIELQKSEANAREAIRQSSLDRVRAEIASMRTTGDLDRITPLIWNELTTLGVPFIRCGVFIMDEPLQLIHTYLSTPDGKAIAAFQLHFNADAGNGVNGVALQGWRQKQAVSLHWSEEEFRNFSHSLVEQGEIASEEGYLTEHPPSGLDLHFFPFLQGMLYAGNTEPLSDDDKDLVQALADAFSTAYARFEDFNRLELAKLQVENTLSDLKLAQTKLVQSEKMASLGELTAGIAHEIQNPLNFVNNFSEVNQEMIEELEEELNAGNIEDALAIIADIKQNEQKINHHGKRADGIVKGMLEHSRTGGGEKQPININALADEFMRLSYHGLRAKDKVFNAEMVTNFDPDLPKINVVGQDIGRVILNLFNNAFYAVNQKKKTAGTDYKPEVSVTTSAENGRVVINVKDNGIGIPDAIKEKIMQPFFTTKPTGEGTGLGLSLTYDMVVKGHGGSIQVNSVEGEGSEFIIQLPIN